MSRPRRAHALPGAATLVALLLLLTGCHHRKHTTSRQTPPGTTTQTARHPGSSTERRRGAAEDDADIPSSQAGRAPGGGSAQDRPSATLPPLSVHGEPFRTEVGLASWYGPPYAGRRGADGTVYDQNAMTAAHLTLALGTVVRVTNLVNGQSAVVRITDRGPFVRGRVIDLSLAAAKATGVYRAGVVRVRVEAFNAPPPRPGVPPGGRWCVQVGAFPTEAEAVQQKLDLLGRYPGARVIEFAGPTGYWVRINPRLADFAHANDVADSIHLPDAAQPYLTRTD